MNGCLCRWTCCRRNWRTQKSELRNWRRRPRSRPRDPQSAAECRRPQTAAGRPASDSQTRRLRRTLPVGRPADRPPDLRPHRADRLKISDIPVHSTLNYSTTSIFSLLWTIYYALWFPSLFISFIIIQSLHFQSASCISHDSECNLFSRY